MVKPGCINVFLGPEKEDGDGRPRSSVARSLGRSLGQYVLISCGQLQGCYHHQVQADIGNWFIMTSTPGIPRSRLALEGNPLEPNLAGNVVVNMLKRGGPPIRRAYVMAPIRKHGISPVPSDSFLPLEISGWWVGGGGCWGLRWTRARG